MGLTLHEKAHGRDECGEAEEKKNRRGVCEHTPVRFVCADLRTTERRRVFVRAGERDRWRL